MNDEERKSADTLTEEVQPRDEAPGTFARLGRTVAKHPVKVLVIWLILLLASLPLIFSVSEAIAPGTGEFDAAATESTQAQELINEQFPGSLPNSTAIIVIQAPDVTNEATKGFVLDLEDELLAPGTLEEVESFASVYSIQQAIIEGTALAVGPGIYALEDATLPLNALLFGVPEGHVGIWVQTNFTAFLVYGVPATYLASWLATDANLTIPERDQAANATTFALLESFADQAGLNASTRQLLFGYYGLFFQSWAATAGNATLVADPPLRTQTAIDASVPLFAGGLPDPLFAGFVTAVWQSFSLTSWSDTDAINAFADQTARSVLFEGVDDPAERAALEGYYSLWLAQWNASFVPPATQGLPPNERFLLLVNPTILLFASMQPDPQQAQLMGAIGLWFGPANATDTDAIHAFAIAQTSALSGGQLSPGFLESIYALGRDPSPEAVEAFARGVVMENSLDAFPLPEEILRQFVNEANDTMLLTVAFSVAPLGFGSPEGDPIIRNVLAIRATISDLLAASSPPIDRVLVTGDAAATADASLSGAADLQRIEPVTIIALIVLIGLFFLAIVLPFVPLASILMAFALALAVVFLIGTFIGKVQDTTLTFLFTVMLGVGTDYAIFLIARYREERVEGRSRDEAVQTSVTWAGESIATSGAAVIIAFGVLSLGSFGLLRTMGISIGLGVLVALLVSLTLIPAILMLLGERVFWPTSGQRFARYAQRVRQKRARKKSYFYRAAEISVDHPKAILGLAVLISLPAIYIAFTATTSFDFIGGLTEAESIDGIQVLQESFGAGRLGPTQVVVRFPDAILVDGNLTGDSAGALETLSAAIAPLSNVQDLTGPTRPFGTPVDGTNLTGLGPGERAAALGAIGEDDRTALVTVVFVDSPFTTTSIETVRAIRQEVASLQEQNALLADSDVLVGGQTALTADFSEQTSSEFRTMQIVVVIGIFIVLLVVLGSYLLPLAAILSIGLSITWAYSATILVFNEILQAEVLFLVPFILFILIFGIGMDYNIFILTRIREEAQKGKGTHEATVDAVDRTGGIITALALILAVAVGSLMLSSNRLLQGFGLAISLAVILDAMIVRTYIVPAIMSLLGKWAWRGPKRLQRVK